MCWLSVPEMHITMTFRKYRGNCELWFQCVDKLNFILFRYSFLPKLQSTDIYVYIYVHICTLTRRVTVAYNNVGYICMHALQSLSGICWSKKHIQASLCLHIMYLHCTMYIQVVFIKSTQCLVVLNWVLCEVFTRGLLSHLRWAGLCKWMMNVINYYQFFFLLAYPHIYAHSFE